VTTIKLMADEDRSAPRLACGKRRYRWEKNEQDVLQVELDIDEELRAALRAVHRDPAEAAKEGPGDRLEVIRYRLYHFIGKEACDRLRHAADQKDTVLTIETNDADLFCFPWDQLRWESPKGRLAREVFPDVRFVYRGNQRQASLRAEGGSLEEGGRVCFAWSHADREVPHEAFRDAIFEKLAPWAPARYAVGGWYEEIKNATVASIQGTLQAASEKNDPFRVLHILCHGAVDHQSARLALGEHVSGTDLVTALASEGVLEHLQLVVLTVCAGADGGDPACLQVSPALAFHTRAVPAVLAWSDHVDEPASFSMSYKLYRRLLGAPGKGGGEPQPVMGVAEACAEIRRSSTQAAAAKLYLCAGYIDRPVLPFVFAPFPGLAHFRREDARFYVGREQELDRASDIIKRQREEGEPRVLGVVGDSGSGKSSFLRAALWPRLEAEGYDVKLLIPSVSGSVGGEFVLVEALGERIQVICEEARVRGSGAGGGKDLVIMLDQLEQVLRKSAEAAWAGALTALKGALGAAADDRARVVVVFALRSHHVQKLDGLELQKPDQPRLSAYKYLNLVDKDHKHLNKVDLNARSNETERANLGRMAVEPAHRAGLAWATTEEVEGLVERVASAHSLPLLQFVLHRAWRKRDGARLSLPPGADPGTLLAEEATAVYESPANSLEEKAWQDAIQRILVKLVSIGEESTFDGLRPASRRELVVRSTDGADVREVALDLLVKRRVVIEQGPHAGEETRYLLAHYEFVRRWKSLSDWIDEGRDALRALNEATESAKKWRKESRSSDFLRHRGEDLRQAEDAVARYGGQEKGAAEYLAACRERDRRARLLRRATTGALGVLGAVAAVVGILAIDHARELVNRDDENKAQLRWSAIREARRELVEHRADLAAGRLAPHVRAEQDTGDDHGSRSRRQLTDGTRGVVDRLFLIAVADAPDCVLDPNRGDVGGSSAGDRYLDESKVYVDDKLRLRSLDDHGDTITIWNGVGNWCRWDQCDEPVTYRSRGTPGSRLGGALDAPEEVTDHPDEGALDVIGVSRLGSEHLVLTAGTGSAPDIVVWTRGEGVRALRGEGHDADVAWETVDIVPQNHTYVFGRRRSPGVDCHEGPLVPATHDPSERGARTSPDAHDPRRVVDESRLEEWFVIADDDPEVRTLCLWRCGTLDTDRSLARCPQDSRGWSFTLENRAIARAGFAMDSDDSLNRPAVVVTVIGFMKGELKVGDRKVGGTPDLETAYFAPDRLRYAESDFDRFFSLDGGQITDVAGRAIQPARFHYDQRDRPPSASSADVLNGLASTLMRPSSLASDRPEPNDSVQATVWRIPGVYVWSPVRLPGALVRSRPIDFVDPTTVVAEAGSGATYRWSLDDGEPAIELPDGSSRTHFATSACLGGSKLCWELEVRGWTASEGCLADLYLSPAPRPVEVAGLSARGPVFTRSIAGSNPVCAGSEVPGDAGSEASPWEIIGMDWADGWEPLDLPWMSDLARHMEARTSDADVEPLLEALRHAARDGASDRRSQGAARFVLERWGACRSVSARERDAHWRDDLFRMFAAGSPIDPPL